MTTKRADQLENGDIVVLTLESRQHLAVVNGVMQFERTKTHIALTNYETKAVSEICVPNNLRFDILESN